MQLALVLLFVAVANAAPLFRVSEPIPGRYIVKTKSGIDVQSVLPSVRLAGGRVGFVYKDAFNGFAAELSDKVLDIVLNLPAVEYVEEDGVVRASAVESWGLDRIDAREGLDDSYTPSKTGSGVTVYVLDTGIRKTHNDFGGRVDEEGVSCQGYGNVECDEGKNVGDDGHGHGTHCAGTVGGEMYGVAKGVTLVAVKVLSDSGSGSSAGVIAGINYVAAKTGKRVASLSLGGGYSRSENDAVAAALNAGVSVVVAAGNDNADACNYSPASASSAVTVGATTSADRRATYSNHGSCLDIFAPGSSIKSAGHLTDRSSATMSGTSMACPHVAGAAALLLESGASAQDIKGQLESDATSGVIPNVNGSPNLLLYVD